MNNIGSDIIKCRAQVGTKIAPSEPWRAGEPVSFVYCPSGQHSLTAGFRKNDAITISVLVDEETPGLLQASFDELTRESSQEPFGDEDHAAAKATLRFPPGQTRFTWGEVKGVEGVIISGGTPTSYGADSINGRVYRGWSPEFSTDADMDKATFDKESRHWTFPPFARGSSQNPAKMTGVNFVVGALTNKPAFRAMPPVKARQAEPRPRTSAEVLDQLARRRAALEDLVKQKVLDTFSDLGRG